MEKTIELFKVAPVWVLCAIVGSILLLVGITGHFEFLTLKIANTAPSPIVACFGGAFLVLALAIIARQYLFKREEQEAPATTTWVPESLELVVEHPKNQSLCRKEERFTGTLKGRPSPQNRLWLIRRIERNGGVYAMEEIIPNTSKKNDKYDWSVKGHIGGENGDKRWIEVWLVGEDTHRLLKGLKEMGEKVRKKLMSIDGGKSVWSIYSDLGLSIDPTDKEMLIDLELTRSDR